MTQVELASMTHISLPTLQNIEGGKANPSLHTLEQIFSFFGLDLTFSQKEIDWELLSFWGLPLLQRSNVNRQLGSVREFTHLIKLACNSLLTDKDQSDYKRKLDATQALLIAIQEHYPSTFRRYLEKSKVTNDILPKQIDERLIKLKRIALSFLSEKL